MPKPFNVHNWPDASILLCPNVPKPMHGMAPRTILGKDWWDETRRKAYASTKYHCRACGVHKSAAQDHQWLEGHELYKTDYVKGRLIYQRTVPLCHWCHNFIHNGRMIALVSKGEMDPTKMARIIDHGNELLRQNGLAKPDNYDGPIAAWENWRLVLFGKEYPPKFKSYLDWCEEYG